MPYTVADIHTPMVQAASTLRMLPVQRLRGYKSSWSEVVRQVVTGYGWHDPTWRIPPKARAITEMDEALRWLTWVAGLARRVIWYMGEDPPRTVYAVARENGVVEAEVGLPWQFGLACIVHRLMRPL